jgi:hypothetical protein
MNDRPDEDLYPGVFGCCLVEFKVSVNLKASRARAGGSKVILSSKPLPEDKILVGDPSSSDS